MFNNYKLIYTKYIETFKIAHKKNRVPSNSVSFQFAFFITKLDLGSLYQQHNANIN